MKLLYTIVALVSFVYAMEAQEENRFLNRDFWKAKPSVTEIQEKIKEGHNPTEKNQFSFDGTSYAIIDNAPFESISYMLSLDGNPVTKKTHGGVTYLLWAAYMGNENLMKHLLSLGADPKSKTARGTNILLMAAIGGVDTPEVYDLILEQGVSLDYTSDNGANALLLLSGASLDDTSIFTYFINKKAPIEVKDNDGNNVFFYAARGGDVNLMRFWIEKGVPFDYVNTKGENAIGVASQGMRRRALRLETFDYLSNELGIAVDQINWKGETPLHFSARNGSPEVLDFLVSNGVSSRQINSDGNTALINAASGSSENLKKIMSYEHKLNHKNNDGNTALTMSIKRNKEENVALLIAAGADVNIIDAKGNNLMYYAFKYYNSKKENNGTGIIEKLEAAGLDGNGSYENQNTLAHIAIEKHSPALLQKAIALGVNLNSRNEMNLTPLHLAAMKSTNEELIILLIDNGANKKLRTNYDESPYDLAAENEILTNQSVNLSFLKID